MSEMYIKKVIVSINVTKFTFSNFVTSNFRYYKLQRYSGGFVPHPLIGNTRTPIVVKKTPSKPV